MDFDKTDDGIQFYKVDPSDMMIPEFPFLQLNVGEGFLVAKENILEAFHQAITLEANEPGWRHGRMYNPFNSNVIFYRAA